MGSHANGANCGIVEWVKRNALRWFGHIERDEESGVVKKVYVSQSVGTNSRGRPSGRERGRVKEYMCERGATRGRGLDQASKECLDRERWRLFWCGHILGNLPGRSEASEL